MYQIYTCIVYVGKRYVYRSIYLFYFERMSLSMYLWSWIRVKLESLDPLLAYIIFRSSKEKVYISTPLFYLVWKLIWRDCWCESLPHTCTTCQIPFEFRIAAVSFIILNYDLLEKSNCVRKVTQFQLLFSLLIYTPRFLGKFFNILEFLSGYRYL